LNANEHTKSITDFGRFSSQFVTLQIKNTKNLKPCALASARLTGGIWCIVYSILTGMTQNDVFKVFQSCSLQEVWNRRLNRLHLKGDTDSEVEDEGRTIILLRLFVVVIMAALKERILVPEMSAE